MVPVRPVERRVGAAATRRAITLALILAVLGVASPAGGQSLDPAVVTVSDFTAVTLTGAATTTTATMSGFSVEDTAGAGWHVSIQATQFAEVDGAGQYVVGGKTLPIGSLSMPAPTVTPGSGVTVTAGPYTLDGATTQIATAGTGSTGRFDFTQTGSLTLSVPASAYARSYRSEVTVGVHAGP